MTLVLNILRNIIITHSSPEFTIPNLKIQVPISTLLLLLLLPMLYYLSTNVVSGYDITFFCGNVTFKIFY